MRFAFITPRYGAEISSGPEHACRLLAEQMAQRHDVDVITTCARDAATWKNEAAEGPDKIRGVVVRRFTVTQPHDAAAFEALTLRLQKAPPSRADELEWVRQLGPWSPGLIEHLKRQHRTYDALVFFSLHHATTVHGLDIAPDRSVLFPYAQLGPVLRFGLWVDVFRKPQGVGLLSGAERRLIREYVHVTPAHEELVGIGVDPSPQQTYPRHQQDPADVVADEDASVETDGQEEVGYLGGRGIPFRRRHRLYGPILLYGGRVEPDNGCEEMLDYFHAYAATDRDTALVLMGAKMMKIPEEEYVKLAGVLPAGERMVAYEAAEVTITPASDDLLAEALMESLAVGTPVLASARNEAAVEHCRCANAGLYYATRDEFVEGLRLLMTNTKLRERLGENGRQYVRQQYLWDAVMSRFERLVMRPRK